MTHTKGPWTVMEPGTETGPSTAAVCAYDGQVTIYDAPLTEETAANARLIAAAPDLLDALRSLLEGMEASGGWEGDGHLFSAGMAAVRKAEGR